MIYKCTCESQFQDITYGKSMRVFNLTKSSKYRCTVCNKESSCGGVTEKEKKVDKNLTIKK